MGIQFNLNTSRSVRVQFDLSQLPVHTVETGSRGLGVFMMLFALFWGGVPTVILIAAIVSGQFKPAALLTLVFTCIGLAMFVFGVSQFFRRKETTLTADTVTVHEKTLFKNETWSQPLSAYEGVLSRTEHHRSKNSSYTLYICELVHPDPKRKIQLYCSMSGDGFRQIWENYARLLNVPAVEKDGERFLKRDAADLDKSVRELAQEGKLNVDFNPAAAIPPEFQLRALADNVLEVTVIKRPSLIGSVIGLAIAGGMIYPGFFISKPVLPLGVIGIIFGALVVAGTLWSLVARTQILIGPQQVQVRQKTPWGETAGTQILTDRIESVRIGRRTDGSPQDEVLIVTDERTEAIGANVSPNAREWLKNCLLKVITS